jgi:P-type E1-E2 ATPase
MEGNGDILVCLVGAESNIGKYYGMLQENEVQKTPLQEKLEGLATQIGHFGLIMAAATFAVLTLHLIFTTDRFWQFSSLKAIFEYLIIGITIIVVAVPEGLPLAVTISLAYSLDQMKSDHYLVKHLSSCELMGGVNNVCTDKTGTLTLNKMVVKELMLGNELLREKEFRGILNDAKRKFLEK